jgi:hypothetical protein
VSPFVNDSDFKDRRPEAGSAAEVLAMGYAKPVQGAVKRSDPPVRKDGRCRVCLGARRPERARKYRALAELDSFCSTECARQWHGCTLEPGGAGAIGLGLERGRPRKLAA